MSTTTPRQALTAREIAHVLHAELQGNPDVEIDDVQILERASARHLTFVGNQKNLSRVKQTAARLIIVPESIRAELPASEERTWILVPEAEPAFLTVAGILRPPRQRPAIGISSRAIIHESARIGANTNIHPLAVIGADVRIGHSCDIHPGTVIGDGCIIGDNVVLHPGTILYSDVHIGNHVIIHAGCVIGADGFGYRLVNGGHLRLPHLGIVRICDDVEIGACTTIDRAKVGETVIGTGTRIDNQVMIGHNCHVGRHNLLVSQVGFAGSVTTGDYVVCAGQVGVADHVHLGDGAIIGAKAGVHRDMPGGQTYLGAPAGPVAETTKQLIALKRLPEIRDTVRRLEQELAALRKRLGDSAQTSEPAAA
ncbi:MAG: UDP-3-O-(3-hydroxymyristoyl)glucosamine N-acyltransferase [Planctomyces sp.]|jgi:UDP-3-O-[3-hydroxymyristoyl] glucosamine N-acyltransferase